ncbi:MAG: M15 family metallopeptidase [Chloroflexi bacterium]|nr:M15 family metallopeptidase [Chloroflexota bacterium]
MKLLVELYIVLHMLMGAPLDVLVDARHPLPRWFDPGPHPDAVSALEDLISEASDAGIKAIEYSGYRSYSKQGSTVEREWKEKPLTASFYVAAPGHSEHQLGTAFDLVWPGLKVEFSDPRNEQLYIWLEENAHHFGFVLSYPYKEIEGWPYNNRWMPQVTEFIHEPWHIRYVGIPLAEEIFAAGYLDPQNSILPQDYYQPWTAISP